MTYSRRVGDKIRRRDTGEATHLGERGETKLSATDRRKLINVLLGAKRTKGKLQISAVHVQKLLDGLANLGEHTSLQSVAEACYEKLGALLENKRHGVKSVNGVAYCTLNQERVTNLFGWIDSWSVAKNHFMVAKKEEILKTHVSSVDHMIMQDKEPAKTMVAQRALTMDLLSGTRLIEEGGALFPYLSVDAWPFNNELPGGKYRRPDNMEKIGDSVLENMAVKEVLSRVLITIASGVPVGRLCLKLIEELGGRWARFPDDAYYTLNIPGGHVMCTASSAEGDITGVFLFRLPYQDTARLLTVVSQLGSGYFGEAHYHWPEKMNTDVSIFNVLRVLAGLPQNANTSQTAIFKAVVLDRLESDRAERMRCYWENGRWLSGAQLCGEAGGVAAGVSYRDAVRRGVEDPKNEEAVAEAERRREAKAAGGKKGGKKGGKMTHIRKLEKQGPFTHACLACSKFGMAGKQCQLCPKRGEGSICYFRLCLACQDVGADNSGLSCRHHKLLSTRGREIEFARGEVYDHAAHEEAVKAGHEAREKLIKAKREELKG